MHSVCRCSLLVWRRSFLKKGTPVTYFCPALDPPLGGSGQKTTTLVRDHDYFIPTKFHQNPSSGSGEVENVKSLRTMDGRQRRLTDGRRAMAIAHLSHWLRWAKKAVVCLLFIQNKAIWVIIISLAWGSIHYIVRYGIPLQKSFMFSHVTQLWIKCGSRLNSVSMQILFFKRDFVRSTVKPDILRID